MAGPVHAYDSELGLYAPINPFNDGFLERGIHHIYFEEIGNPEGIPVLFYTGGQERAARLHTDDCLIRSGIV